MSSREAAIPAICGVAAFGASYLATKAVLFACGHGMPTGNIYYLPSPNSVIGSLLGAIAVLFTAPAGTLQRMGLVNGKGRMMVFRSLLDYRGMVFDPRDLHYCLMERPTVFIKGERYRLLRVVLGSGLVTLEDEAVHTVQRKAISPSFSAMTIRKLADSIFSRHFAKMAAAWREHAQPAISSEGKAIPSDPLDLQEPLDHTTLAIVGEAAFRTDKLEVVEHLLRATRIKLTPLMILPASVFKWLPSEMKRTAIRTRKALSHELEQVVAEVRAEGPPSTDDQVKSLIDAMAFSTVLSSQDLLDNAVTFVFAGHDTTSTALNWTLYYLSQNPSVQTKVFEELSSCFHLATVPSLTDVEQSCPYLHNVILESLRVQPPVFHVIRVATQDEYLPSGVFVPKGTQLFLSVYGVHRLPQLWGPDADVFRPERWSENPEALHQRLGPCGFMPFIVGKRNCIGKEFALAELHLALAMVLRRVEVRWPEGQATPSLRTGPVVRSAEPFKLLLVRRPN